MKKLFDILKLKRVMFPLVFFGQLAVFITIATIFGLETQNSPLGFAYAVVMSVTIIYFCLKTIKDHREWLKSIKDPIFGAPILLMLLYVPIFILGIVLVYFIFNIGNYLNA